MIQPFGMHQLSLFKSGTEWMNDITNSLDRKTDKEGNVESMSDLWSRKTEESRRSFWQRPDPRTVRGDSSPLIRNTERGAGVHASMSSSGYDPTKTDFMETKPTIWLDGDDQTQGEGHHRVATAAALEKETGRTMWIPTNYQSFNRQPAKPLYEDDML